VRKETSRDRRLTSRATRPRRERSVKRASLAELAARHSILPSYEGIDGMERAAPQETLRRLLAAFGVPAENPEQVAASLSTAPEAPDPRLRGPAGVCCFLPRWLETGRGWGIAIQLYQLRSSRNWGIGDFVDLAEFARIAGAAGADFVGLNPLHALFLANPAHCSPFSPSNRRFLNPLYIAVDAVPGYRPADGSGAGADAEQEFVDYAAVAERKLAALRSVWRRGPGDPDALAQFVTEGGEALRRHALFEAISARMVAEGATAGWHGWPPEWRDAAGAACEAFAAAHPDEIEFHAWLQWLCARQLEAAKAAALGAGMRIGLYYDLAVGEAPDGSSTWSEPRLTVRGARVGAPPDYFSADGQDWGLAPLSPVELRATGGAPFRAMIENAARDAGALRIDHAMALWQLFLIPDGAHPAEGTYVRYPLGQMIGALAEASRSHETVMIGEDLGNVPSGFRQVMEAAIVLSYRILYFERDKAGYIEPARYPRNAIVCLSTHDLPTFEGWWLGEDVSLRARYGLIGAEAEAEQAEMRTLERQQLHADLVGEGLLDGPVEPPPATTAPLFVAVHRRLARTPSRLLAARIEDLVGQREPVNLPGTSDQYPNWRRKLAVPLEMLYEHPLFRAITAALRDERGRDAP
jgi:4-alpha-glucanotransferase